MLREKVEEAVLNLKAEKSLGVDKMSSEVLKNGGEATIIILTAICQNWETKEWPKEWTQSLVIPVLKRGNLNHCQTYRTISLINYPSKIMLRFILKRLKAEAEELLAEEQAGLQPGLSTVELIFSGRVIGNRHRKR